MDKTLLKNFAKESRKDLTKKIAVKINSYFVEDDFKEEIKGDVVVLSNSAHNLTITRDKYEKRKVLITRIKDLGLNQVIEEASYTWFNRFVAIRYMEINNMLPLTKDNESLNIRVLSSIDNKLDPEIMSYSNITNPELDLKINKDQYAELKSDNEKFEYILLKVCEKLGKVIPQVFDGVTDYINILSPHNLLTEESFISKLISIPEESFKDVEVIGWLYQYYISEQKDLVFSELKKNIKISKEKIPAVTQLFTPDWIVKYMVENSLGKYWLENKESMDIYPSDNLYHSDDLYPSNSLKSNWKYYIEDAEQEPEVQEELDKLKNPNLNPKDITFIDPCSGSGHILVYAFEVLYQIYESYGYNKREIPKLILENNIYGLDIDDRAGQLSILSLLLKARAFDKELFKKDIKLNVYSIQESNYINESVLYDIRSKETNEIIDYVLEVFKDAKEYGSILKVEKKDYKLLIDKINQVETLFRKELEEKFIPLLEQAIILSNKYDVVVTNPPYAGSKGFDKLLETYSKSNYHNSKSDLFAIFIEKTLDLVSSNGLVSLVTPSSWMYNPRYESLRMSLCENMEIYSLIDLGSDAFDVGFGTVTYVFGPQNYRGKFYGKYFDVTIKKEKEKFIEEKPYKSLVHSFKLYEEYKFSYRISNVYKTILLNSEKLYNYGKPRSGLQTNNNNLFIRFWYEIEYTKSFFKYDKSTPFPNKTWFPHVKGGPYRKWYGNFDSVVNWRESGKDIIDLATTLYGSFTRTVKSLEYYFCEGLTWSHTTYSQPFAIRFLPKGIISNVEGPSIFELCNKELYIMGLLNTKITDNILSKLTSSIHYLVGEVSNFPIIIFEKCKGKVDELVQMNVDISKTEWDSFEKSWDFEKHPLMKFKNNNSIQESFKVWESFTEKQFNQLKANEEELNRIFIDIYGLQDELTPEVEDKDVTIRKAVEERDIKSLISYAVGCMFGRYSLDQDGLVYAGGEFDNSKYITFKADKDNVIPINDNNYFMDDIVVKFKEFIKVAFGEEKLHENLEYIADVLGKRNTETSEDTIRRYFINGFYKDHLKIYKKRPIYWLFDSGKANGFKCLIYMHRYEENLAAKIRIDYLHKIQRVYEKELDEVKYKLTGELSPNERKDAMNLQKDLSNKLTEIKEYNENLDHIANQKINIDLDDGVKVNYAKFETVLAKIK